VTMSTAALTIATLTVNNYTGTITLNQNLTMNTGGSMNAGTIVQGAGSGPIGTSLMFSGGTFAWSGGNINYTGTGLWVGILSISSGAEVDFTNTTANTTVHLGDNVSNGGTLKLANTYPVELDITPTIENLPGGRINITVTNTSGLVLPSPTATVTTILNSGTIEKTTASSDQYDIADSVSNEASGAILQVDAGTLQFDRGDPAAPHWGIVQTSGKIQVSVGAKLAAPYNINVSAGTIQTDGNNGTAKISGKLTMSGGLLQVGDGSDPNVFLALDSNFTWSGGTVSLVYNLTTSTGSSILVTGNVTVGATGTILTVAFVGTGAGPGEFYPILTFGGGSVSNVAASNNVTGYTASIDADGDYLLTKN